MRKEFKFSINDHQIRIVNHWRRGIKLYINGDFKDHDSSFFANGKFAALSANLGEEGILEVFPRSEIWSVEIDVLLTKHNTTTKVFSSDKRLSLQEQRVAK